ncbi:nuclear transport factor 2 family protein [Nocardia sp. ET3-3]|uniref:Nuclear transport factor 2 family protein n=1 Tax=Nocardia terrae TaxID=2675851 RepID=A0A7K1US55_9NOCA|nr:nuclear transport factor 2 family protein [Nocardia terrae]MVU77111.1 nuclear transport factor 2 family protein [Nocardia terrae]
MLTEDTARRVIDTYFRAWETQDPALIVTIFTENATYAERAFEEPHRGRTGIAAYWKDKVVGDESDIRCRLLSLYLDGQTAIAEWEAEFADLGVRKLMREVAILEFDGDKIASLREYWQTKNL